MKALAASVRSKIAAMLPRLASAHDGERLATVAAIQRTLSGAGHDLHDLAAVVAETPDRKRRAEQDRDRPRRADDHHAPAVFWEDLNAVERRRWLDAMVYQAVFSDWERNFLDNTRRRFLDYGDRVRLSDKQVGVCNRLLWKAVREGVHP